MKDSSLFRIALITIILGSTILFFVSEKIKIDEKTVSELKNKKPNEYIKITGEITDIIKADEITVIRLAKTETIKIVILDKISLNKGDIIEVIGKIQDHNGEREVIAQRIRLVS